MLKILDHLTEHMSRVEMHKRYKGYAFIVVDTQDEHDKNGVSLPCSGKVYAVSDLEGYDGLLQESLRLHKQSIPNMIDDIELPSEDELIGAEGGITCLEC